MYVFNTCFCTNVECPDEGFRLTGMDILLKGSLDIQNYYIQHQGSFQVLLLTVVQTSLLFTGCGP